MSHRFLTLLAAAIAFAAIPVAAQNRPTAPAAPKPATTAPKAAPHDENRRRGPPLGRLVRDRDRLAQ